MVVWDPFKPLGGNTPEQLQNANSSSGRGTARFTRGSASSRSRRRGTTIRASTSSSTRSAGLEVVEAADMDGSTEFIIDTIRNAPEGSNWAVGTEINLVKRLDAEHPDKTIFCLDPVICPCCTMYRVHPAYVLWVLEHLANGDVVNKITVDDETKRWSLVALERMLSVA